MVIPSSVRNEVLRTHHSAHQGLSSMATCALSIVFSPDISTAIQETRDRCRSCKKSRTVTGCDSLAALDTPSTPFELVFADFCDYGGCHDLVFRVGWTSTKLPRSGTQYYGATGLIACHRQMFAGFGVTEILQSDVGPKFTDTETSNFRACRDGGGRGWGG